MQDCNTNSHAVTNKKYCIASTVAISGNAPPRLNYCQRDPVPPPADCGQLNICLNKINNIHVRTACYGICLSLLILNSCKAQKLEKVLADGAFKGYVKTGKGVPGIDYTLTLNKDSTFIFNITAHLGNSGCRGKWTVVQSKVVLACDKANDVGQVLTRGNVGPVEELKIINKNKLKYKDVVLKRKSR